MRMVLSLCILHTVNGVLVQMQPYSKIGQNSLFYYIYDVLCVVQRSNA